MGSAVLCVVLSLLSTYTCTRSFVIAATFLLASSFVFPCFSSLLFSFILTSEYLHCEIMSEQKKLLILISKGVSDRTQATNQSRTLTLLQAKRTPYIAVDGMDPNMKEIRNELFDISGIRGNYPQFFFAYPDGSTTYLGDFDKLEAINESSHIPKEVLDDHPGIETWDRVFSNVVSSFSSS